MRWKIGIGIIVFLCLVCVGAFAGYEAGKPAIKTPTVVAASTDGQLGELITEYNDGAVMQGHYRNSIKVGEWNVIYGTTLSTANFVNGMVEGDISVRRVATGELIGEGVYKHDKKLEVTTFTDYKAKICIYIDGEESCILKVDPVFVAERRRYQQRLLAERCRDHYRGEYSICKEAVVGAEDGEWGCLSRLAPKVSFCLIRGSYL